jgi:hypothetical protein
VCYKMAVLDPESDMALLRIIQREVADVFLRVEFCSLFIRVRPTSTKVSNG